MRASSFAARSAISFRPRLEGLETRDTPTVTYHGGNLLPAVDTQAVFYGGGWSADTSTPGRVDTYLHSLTTGAYMQALQGAGYGVGPGTSEAGVADPISLTAGSVITDASIQAELKADIAAGGVQADNANRLYVVYVQPDVAVRLPGNQGTTQQGILGYHGAFVDGSETVRYAVIAYPGGAAHNSILSLPNQTVSVFDQLTAITSHEVAEAATDPDVSFATSPRSGYLGWYDSRLGEIGDIEENNVNAFVRINLTTADGDAYLVQEVGTINDQLLTIAPPTNSPPPAPASATTTTVTAGPVTYHRTFATETLTVTVTPASGTTLPTGTVTLIYNGQVIGTATLHTVNGVATATFGLTYAYHGYYTFTAQYFGDATYSGGTSPPVTVAV